MMDSYSSPSRPIPHFFDYNTFTTKKARYNSTPCPKKVPPRPPSKSVPPISRFFSRPNHQKAIAISFKDNSDSSLSKHYDSSREESYFEQCFHVECKIGSGSFGDVFKVKSKEDGRYYAIKKSRERFKGKSDRERKLEEVRKHEQLPKHLNCVNLYKAWEERQHLYIQTELCQTSLSDFTEINHDIPEKVVRNYLVDLLKAVRHLHNHQLIHLDIKPENIFISDDGLCKLGDFGLVLDINKNDTNEATEGDPKYLAKELMQGQFTKAADIFSLGITILEIACDLDLPNGGEGWHQLRDGQIPDQLLNGISFELRNIIKLMMDPDYQRRPSADELLHHPFICKIERNRRWKLKAKHSYDLAKRLVNWFFHFFYKIFVFICYPFKYLYKLFKRKPTTKTFCNLNNSNRQPLNDWDSNYSDDDVFDTSSVSVLDNSTVFNISSNNDERFNSNDSSFDNSNFTNDRNYYSTSGKLRHRPIFDDSFKSPTFKTSSPIERLYNSSIHDSPQLFQDSNNRSKAFISQKLDFDNEFEDNDTSDWNKSFSIGPKNLLSEFDEIENEANDDSFE